MMPVTTAAAPIVLATLFSSSLGFHLSCFHPRRSNSSSYGGSFLHSGRVSSSATGSSDCTPSQGRRRRRPRRPIQSLHFLSKNNDDNIAVEKSSLSGMPIGPSSKILISTADASTSPSPPPNHPVNHPPPPVILRYMYEGGHLSQGRLCFLDISHPSTTATSYDNGYTVTIPQVIRALTDDGVDFNLFYACAYESQCSTGGWLPLEPAPRYSNPWIADNGIDSSNGDDAVDKGHEPTLTFTVPSSTSTESNGQRRIDIKLFRRPKMPTRGIVDYSHLELMKDVSNNDPSLTKDVNELTCAEYSNDALHAISASVPCGKLPMDGYFGIGILHPKACENVGTLWRSAYQLGASVLYTIGGRYKSSSTDTLNVPGRIPLIELNDWSSFVEWASPKAAVWVVIEMGGTPLSEFVHPRNAIYILGSEDHGVPTSVVRSCREVISLECELYGSYNVAVAGSIVMYDRMMKMRKANEKRRG